MLRSKTWSVVVAGDDAVLRRRTVNQVTATPSFAVVTEESGSVMVSQTVRHRPDLLVFTAHLLRLVDLSRVRLLARCRRCPMMVLVVDFPDLVRGTGRWSYRALAHLDRSVRPASQAASPRSRRAGEGVYQIRVEDFAPRRRNPHSGRVSSVQVAPRGTAQSD